MTFSEKQVQLLNEPINKNNVSERWADKEKTFKLSYVEGWHVIKEANRIFGFDGWLSETVYSRMVYADEKVVSYTAKVRITVGDVFREGIGAGHGRMGGIGDKHESAVKEAETDARKRAFMQFGDQFGLSLYDKHQAWAKKTPAPKEKPPVKTAPPEKDDGESLTKQFLAYLEKNPKKTKALKENLNNRYGQGKINEKQRDQVLAAILEVEDQ